MGGPTPSGAANPLAGGQPTSPSVANPLAGGQPNQPPVQAGTPAGGTAANPLAGGQPADPTTSPDDSAPVSRDVYNERVRAETALRKRLTEIEAQLKAQEDAKLTEGERDKKRIAELEREQTEYLLDRQEWRLQRAVDAEAAGLRLVDARDAMYLLKRDYGDQIEFDDDGSPQNIPYLLRRLVEKKPYLITQDAPQAQSPSSGRLVSPPRPGARPPAPQPRPLSAADSLSAMDWEQASRRPGQ